MVIDTGRLDGFDLLGTPVWLLDARAGRILWRNAAAETLMLPPCVPGPPAPPDGERLAMLLSRHLADSGAPGEAEAALEGLDLRLETTARDIVPHRCSARAWHGAPGIFIVQAWPDRGAGGTSGLDAWLSHSASILRASAAGMPAAEVLALVVAMVERAMPDISCSVTLLDRSGRRVETVIAPTMANSYNAALVGLEIGAEEGSCGAAMATGQRVIAADIATHPFWRAYRELALSHGLRACWSEPLRDAEGRVIGSFALYSSLPRRPDPRRLRVMEAASNLASIALEAERHRTEARAAEARLAERESAFRSLLDASPSLIFLKDTAGRYRAINRTFRQVYGLDESRVLGRTAAEVFGAEVAADFLADEADLGPERPVVTRRFEDPAIPGLSVEGVKFLVRGEDGSVAGVGGICADVTAERRAEAELAVVSERLALAVAASGIGILDYDVVRDRLSADARLGEIFGVGGRRAQMTRPADWLAHVHPEDAGGVRTLFDAAMSGKTSQHAAFRIRRPDGAVRHLRSAARAIFADGGPSRLVVIAMDVTADVVMSEALAERSREAEAASLAKSRFLANMSHELRTPLNGVLGCAQLLGRTELAPAQRRHLDVIETSGRALLDLIEDLLDIGRIEAGVVALDTGPVDLAALAAQAVEMVRDAATARGLGLKTHVAPDLATERLGDARRLRQVMLNLLTNAVKFTPEGRVEIGLARRQGDGVRIWVRDTGPGIPVETRTTIFERFARGAAGGSAPGTGLGLAITRDLVTLMGGRIAVEDAEGGGTRFVVDLALAEAYADRRSPARPAGGAGARV